MNTYLDIAAVRIQTYLTRWPNLLGRRAASQMLSKATSADAVQSQLKRMGISNVCLHGEAGDVDGVIGLRFDSVATDKEASKLAEGLILQLRQQLPAAEWVAVWGNGEDYVSARSHTIQKKLNNGDTLAGYGPLNEVPFARRCSLSAVDIAISEIQRYEEKYSIGHDAQMRYTAAKGKTTRDSIEGPVETLHGRPSPNDFNALAALAGNAVDRAGRQHKKNHLATIFIDGNGLGDFFTALVEQKISTKTEVSSAIVSATKSALEQGINAMEMEAIEVSKYTPLILHIVGGDDVLVSVPAAAAFPFTLTFVTAFDEHIQQAIQQHAPALDSTTTLPSASAGVAITHKSFPFNMTVAIVERLLRRAKRKHRGLEASLCWTDVTRFGVDVEHRPTWTASALKENEETLTTLATLGRSTVTGLATAADHPVEQIAAARLRVELRRDKQAQLVPFASNPQRFLEMIELARWW